MAKPQCIASTTQTRASISIGEKDSLVKVGWKYEGVGWYAPTKSNDPVYRLYNPNAGDHHYTPNAAEKNSLVKVGWRYEGIGWYSSETKALKIYRAYNPNAKAGSHNYTANGGEQKNLVSLGWRDEGIGWYALNRAPQPPGRTEIAPPAKLAAWCASHGYKLGKFYAGENNGHLGQYDPSDRSYETTAQEILFDIADAEAKGELTPFGNKVYYNSWDSESLNGANRVVTFF